MGDRKPLLSYDIDDDAYEKLRRDVRRERVIDDTSQFHSDDFAAVSRGPKANGNGNDSSSNRTRNAFIAICVVIILVVVGVVIGLAVHAHHQNQQTPSPPEPAPTTPPVDEPGSVEIPPSGGEASIDLTFLCNVPFPNGTCRAVFGYENGAVEPLEVDAGSNNKIEPGPHDRGQRTQFDAGTRFGGATFLWNCATHSHAKWTLITAGIASVATAPHTHVACPPLPI